MLNDDKNMDNQKFEDANDIEMDLEEMHLAQQQYESTVEQETEDEEEQKLKEKKAAPLNTAPDELVLNDESDDFEEALVIDDIDIVIDEDIIIGEDTDSAPTAKPIPAAQVEAETSETNADLGVDIDFTDDVFNNPDYTKAVSTDELDVIDEIIGDSSENLNLVLNLNIIDDDTADTERPQLRLGVDESEKSIPVNNDAFEAFATTGELSDNLAGNLDIKPAPPAKKEEPPKKMKPKAPPKPPVKPVSPVAKAAVPPVKPAPPVAKPVEPAKSEVKPVVETKDEEIVDSKTFFDNIDAAKKPTSFENNSLYAQTAKEMEEAANKSKLEAEAEAELEAFVEEQPADEEVTPIIDEKPEVITQADENLDSWQNELKEDSSSQITEFEEQLIDLTLNSNTTLAQEMYKLTEQIDTIKSTLDKQAVAGVSDGNTSSISLQLEAFKEQLTLQLVQLFEGISFNEELYELNSFIGDNFNKLKEEVELTNKQTSELRAALDDSFKRLSISVGDMPANVSSSDTDEKFDVLKDISEKLYLLEEIALSLKSCDDKDSFATSVNKVQEKLEETIAKIPEMIQGTSAEGKDENYSYGLVDVESDLAKMRVVINEMSNTVKSFNKVMDESPSSAQIDCLYDDISSISKRTNKLILTSDDAHKTLKHYLEEFELVIKQVDEKTGNLNSYPQQVQGIHTKLDNLTRLLLSTTKSDKALNDALLYLAQWIDSATASFDTLKKDAQVVKNVTIEKIDGLEDKIKTMEKAFDSKFDAVEKSVNTKFELIEKKIDNKFEIIEEKLDNVLKFKSTIETIMSQVTTTHESLKKTFDINEKLDVLEHKMTRFEKNINKIASYIEE